VEYDRAFYGSQCALMAPLLITLTYDPQAKTLRVDAPETPVTAIGHAS
jgi:hypothetical protein